MRGLIDTADTLVTGPTREPIDLDETKRALRFAQTGEDTLIDTYISGARHYFEVETGRQVMTATRELWLDAFPIHRQIELPWPPLQSVVSITYTDGAGDDQVMDAALYQVLAPQGPHCQRGRVTLVSGAAWPGAGDAPKAVRIRFTCGYGSVPGDVPELIKGILYDLVGDAHQYRSQTYEGSGSMTLQALPRTQEVLRGFRQSAIPTLLPRYSTWASQYQAWYVAP